MPAANRVSLPSGCARETQLWLLIQNVETRYELSLLERRLGVKRSNISRKSQTNWEYLDALRDADIDLSDIPEITPEMFAKAVVRRGLRPLRYKSQVTLRLDSDVLTWFKTQGRGYQTRMNALLRAYMEAYEKQTNSRRQRQTRGLTATSHRLLGKHAKRSF